MPAQAKRRRIGEVSDKDSTSSLDESDADYQDEDPSEDPKVFFFGTVPYHKASREHQCYSYEASESIARLQHVTFTICNVQRYLHHPMPGS